MKRAAIAFVVIAALIGRPAVAADMAVKALPLLPAPLSSWTGFYVGGNVGYSLGRANTDLAGDGSVTSVASPPALPFLIQIRPT